MKDQSGHTNRAGVETTPLLIITEYSGPKVFVVEGLQPFGSCVLCLDYNTVHLTVINANQTTAIVDIQVHGDWYISLGSLDSHNVAKSDLWV